MSSQPIFSLNNSVIIDASMGASVNSNVQEISECNCIAVQVIWSAGSNPIGSVKLQASLDNITFTDISGTSLSVSGNSGSHFYNFDRPGFPYLRVVYTRTAGSGTLNAKICGKRG